MSDILSGVVSVEKGSVIIPLAELMEKKFLRRKTPLSRSHVSNMTRAGNVENAPCLWALHNLRQSPLPKAGRITHRFTRFLFAQVENDNAQILQLCAKLVASH